MIEIKFNYQINKQCPPKDKFGISYSLDEFKTYHAIEIYEAHGWKYINEPKIMIIYGHEEMIVLNDKGKELSRFYIR